MRKRKTDSVDLPTTEQIEGELVRLRYKSRYSRTLRSTIAILIVVAALAVLVATLWMPVLRIYGSSMSPTLVDGQIVISVKNARFEPGDVAAFYHGNKLLIKRYIAGPGDWVDPGRRRQRLRQRQPPGGAVSHRKGLRRDQHPAALSGPGRTVFPHGG